MDGIGAFLSVVCTAIVLPLFSDLLGLSKSLLLILAMIPASYMVYSLVCYFLVNQIRAWMLGAIIVANIIYCLITGTLILLYKPITNIGIGFLMMEILVILLVVYLEIKVLKKEF